MGIQIIGSTTTAQEVETNSKAARVTIRPIDVGSLGSYRIAAFSGLTTGIAAATPIFAWRWSDATRFAILRYLRVRAAVITGFTAAQELALDAVIARSYSASETVGTALVTPGAVGNNQKKRTSMGASLIGAIHMAAAAAVSGGTRTLDANPFLAQQAKTLAAAATVQDASLEATLDLTTSADYPYVFAQNEGFVVRNVIAMGAGGTVRWMVETAWDEVASY